MKNLRPWYRLKFSSLQTKQYLHRGKTKTAPILTILPGFNDNSVLYCQSERPRTACLSEPNQVSWMFEHFVYSSSIFNKIQYIVFQVYVIRYQHYQLIVILYILSSACLFFTGSTPTKHWYFRQQGTRAYILMYTILLYTRSKWGIAFIPTSVEYAPSRYIWNWQGHACLSFIYRTCSWYHSN